MKNSIENAKETFNIVAKNFLKYNSELTDYWKGKVSKKYFMNLETTNNSIDTLSSHLSIYS